MSDGTEKQPDPTKATQLAESFLEQHRQELSAEREREIAGEIEQWEERRTGLSEDDELFKIATAHIEQGKERLQELQNATDELEQELLAVVSAGFVARGDWLDEHILRALNLILFNKYSNSFVVKRQVINEGASFDDDELYAVSRAVRDLAAKRLEDT